MFGTFLDGCGWMVFGASMAWVNVRWGAPPPRPPARGAPARWTPRKTGLGAPQYGDYVRTSWKNDFFSLRALKLLAIHEKQLLTFFGFLPPYFGVLRSLA